MKYMILFLVYLFIFNNMLSEDWLIYKGNFLYTGNNDEIIIKDTKLKWIFKASSSIYNPVISDGKIYFTDIKKNVYCINQENGRLIWFLNLQNISSKFLGYSPPPGKVNHPLIKDNLLFISDSTALFAINKNSAKVEWARAGYQEIKKDRAVVDGIYSTPLIYSNTIIYGTRNFFLSREIREGHIKWDNPSIFTYGGFPSFYENKIFTQSKDFKNNKFYVLCLDAETGKINWQIDLENPIQIFPPLAFKNYVYIPINKNLYCLSMNNGNIIWNRSYEDIITSSPSFTENELILTIGNRKIARIDINNGNIIEEWNLDNQSSPYYVVIKDRIYISYIIKKNDKYYTGIKAYIFNQKEPILDYISIFEGYPSQCAASTGTLYFTSGEYLYALGGGSNSYELISFENEISNNNIKEGNVNNNTYIAKNKYQTNIIETNISFENVNKGDSINVENIYFEFDSAYLKPESIAILDNIVSQLKKFKNIKLEIRGHTDSQGSKDYNMKLSLRRADSVMTYLIKNGISPERLSIKGFGDTKPIADNSTEEGRKKNRRTEFFIIEK